MKLTVVGEIAEFYVQTLCLLFFPCSKFSASAESADTEPEITVKSVKIKEGFEAFVDIALCGKIYSGHCITERDDLLSNPAMAEKITVGKAFLQAGFKTCKTSPPWGVLTGVRPSKLAMKNLNSGMTFSQNVEALISDFGLEEEKANLAVTVAENEKRLILPEYYGQCSVYIAIPFCPSRCTYCSFVSFTSEKLLSLIPEYLTVLAKEITAKAALIEKLGLKVTTIYVGGGTPTVLNENQLEFLLDSISSSFDVGAACEFTLEAGRPDTITEEKLKIAKKHGVTRISVNAQTLNDDILKSIGRAHTSDGFRHAFDTARRSGIQCVNVDLIAGLPGESAESFKRSVDEIANLNPENITVHAFSVKKSSHLKREGAQSYASDAAAARCGVSYSQRKFAECDYTPYYLYRQKNTVCNLENVGFSHKRHEGLYNILMMEEIQSIFAVGASAVSKLVYTDSCGKAFIERIAENKYPFEYLSEKSSENFDRSCEKYGERVFDFYKKYFK